jgi:WD40 repeat protein
MFRLFVSSTFSDFIAEREALQKKVFPELEKYCAERGARFQAVDLRWGISEEAQREHDTMRICLEEVRRCQQLSPRPNFAVLLGDRYGWEPVPARIPQDHWKRLIQAAGKADRKLIEESYRLDENAVPPVYCLRERTQAEDAFQRAAKLLQALRHAARSFRGSARLPYFASATHQEIAIGALSRRDELGRPLSPEQHVHVYVRHLSGLPQDDSASDFIDRDAESGEADHGARERLRVLERQLRRQLGDHVHDLHTNWSRHGRNGAVNKAYLKRFCDAFLSHQKALIDAEFDSLQQVDERQQREQAHQDFGAERARVFAGRQALLAKIDRYTVITPSGRSARPANKGSPAAPLILLGGGGSGKSAVLARAAQESVQQSKRSGAIVLQRYIGGVPGTESLMTMLTALTADIASLYGQPEPQIPENVKALAENFQAALGHAHSRRPLILYLDALDQLDKADRAWMLEWLPKELPAHVRVVTSARTDTNAEQSARRRYAKELIEVPAMNPAEGRAMLRAWLNDKRAAWFNAGIAPSTGRLLTSQQEQAILAAFNASGNGSALWLKLAYEEAAAWASWDAPRQLPNTIPGLIEDLIDRRLIKHENHPKVFTERALAYLTAGRFGLSESELGRALGTDKTVRDEFEADEKTQKRWEDDKKLPPILWSRLFFDLQPYLGFAQADGALLMRWFHREFGQVLKARYLASEEDRMTIHGALADTFLELERELRPDEANDDALFKATDASGKQVSAALRRVMEQPWQLAQAGKHEELQALITDFGFCMAKCALNRPDDLLADHTLLPPGSDSKGTVDTWRRFLVSRSSLLYRGDREWPASRILLQLACETPDDSITGLAAARWLNAGGETRPWLRSHYREPVLKASMVLEGHEGHFSSFVALELEGGRLLSRHVDYRLWNLDSGECEKTHALDEPVLVISARGDRRFEHPQLGPRGEAMFWSARPETIRFRACDIEGMSLCNAVELQDGRVLSLADRRTPQAASPRGAAAPCTLEGHEDEVTGFLQLQDGQVLTWGKDATLRLWSLPPVGSEERVAPVACVDLHRAPILGAIELPSGAIVSWDFAGGFLWTEPTAPPRTLWLEGLGYDGPPDQATQRETYRERYDVESVWQRGTQGSDHRAAGAQWTVHAGVERLLAWRPGGLHWYDAQGQGLCHQDMGDSCDDLTGVIDLPGFGSARTFDQDNKIVLQAYGSDEVTEIEEPEAGSISGILRLDDDRFCTWSGRKRGDSALRIWSAIEGDWRRGVELQSRLQGHSRWIHTVALLQGRRVASCGEDDAIRVWDLDVREPDLPKPVAANVPRYVGGGYWRVHLHGYSNAGTRYPLVLVDALGGHARVIDEIWYTRIPNEVTVQQGLAVVENEAVVDEESQVIGFECSPTDDMVQGVSRAEARLDLMDRHLILAVRTPAEDAGESAACDLTAWVFGIGDTHYWEAAHQELPLPGLRPLVRLPDHRFAAWGDTDRIEIWRVSLEDFGEQEVFQLVAQVHPLPSVPQGVVAIDDQTLLAWSEAGWLLQVRVKDGQVLHRYDLLGLAGLEAAPGLAPLAWDRSGQVWRLDLATGQAQVLSRSPDADVTGLVALTPTDFISVSTDGCLRRWTFDGAAAHSTVLFPGRFMSKAQFFWSLDLEEDSGLPAGNPIRDADGNVLMMTTFAPAAFALLLYTRASDALHLLLIDEDRVRVFDAVVPERPLCVWHFARSSDRDPNLELGLSPAGDVVVLAGTALQRLQLMQGKQRLRLDAHR